MKTLEKETLTKWLLENNYILETAVENIEFDENSLPFYYLHGCKMMLSKQSLN